MPNRIASCDTNSIDRNAHNFDTYPQRVEFVAFALSEVVVLVAAVEVVKAYPEPLLIFGKAQFQRLADGKALLDRARIGFAKNCISIGGFFR